MRLKRANQDHRLTIGVAESVTCGQLQARIGAQPELSELLKGGITAYSIDQKVKLLGVDAGHASKCNCVSARVADEMASGVCCLFGVEVGVATTGYAESPDKKKAPSAFWSVCSNDGSCLKIVKRGRVVGTRRMSRTAMQARIADKAFDALTRFLQCGR
jgi:nicotinamide-nucleotide amidase